MNIKQHPSWAEAGIRITTEKIWQEQLNRIHNLEVKIQNQKNYIKLVDAKVQRLRNALVVKDIAIKRANDKIKKLKASPKFYAFDQATLEIGLKEKDAKIKELTNELDHFFNHANELGHLAFEKDKLLNEMRKMINSKNLTIARLNSIIDYLRAKLSIVERGE